MEHNLLHDIDKRLAVIEALNSQHAEQTEDQFESLQKQLSGLSKELGQLKLRVAGVATTVSAIVAGAAQWL